jgi:hypothetical protein
MKGEEMKTVILPLNIIEIIEAINILRSEARKTYNQTDRATQMDYQMQYDYAKNDQNIQRMGGTYDDFLRFMYDYKIYRRKKNGKIEYEIEPKNLCRIIKQRAIKLHYSIKKVKNDYSINLLKYNNGEISWNEFGRKYQSCKKSLETKQRELNKLKKLSKRLD